MILMGLSFDGCYLDVNGYQSDSIMGLRLNYLVWESDLSGFS